MGISYVIDGADGARVGAVGRRNLRKLRKLFCENVPAVFLVSFQRIIKKLLEWLKFLSIFSCHCLPSLLHQLFLLFFPLDLSFEDSYHYGTQCLPCSASWAPSEQPPNLSTSFGTMECSTQSASQGKFSTFYLSRSPDTSKQSPCEQNNAARRFFSLAVVIRAILAWITDDAALFGCHEMRIGWFLDELWDDRVFVDYTTCSIR